jgi:hypothetical protein
MSLSIHDAAVTSFVRALQNLSVVLEKGRLHAENEKIEPSVLLGMRLYPDMFPLTRQVQIVSDQCKGGISRLAGLEAPSYPDTETTFAELKTRLDKTVTLVKGIDPKKFEGADARPVELKFPQGSLSMKNGWDYLLLFVLPNVYFHSATAYDILRHAGVKVGKMDFIGPIV